MIKAEEHRKGNYVKTKTDTYTIVDILGDAGLYILRDKDGVLTNRYPGFALNPIPITPDILEKCGFEKTSAADSFKLVMNEDATLVLSVYSGDAYLLMFGDMVNIKSNLKYVHKLQNFYYSFNDTELTITL